MRKRDAAILESYALNPLKTKIIYWMRKIVFDFVRNDGNSALVQLKFFF